MYVPSILWNFINIKPGKNEATCKNLCLNMNDIGTTRWSGFLFHVVFEIFAAFPYEVPNTMTYVSVRNPIVISVDSVRRL
jgi:hypothetical protein